MKKILIANRSEIAVRIINTCRLMGIEAVAIFAEDDRNSLHVAMAHEAYCLGDGPLAETYLNQEKIIQIAKRSKACAIHPGYGFLSERANFSKLCQENNIIFIGPTANAITLMGDKKESKKAMEKIGVPVIPGYHGDGDDEQHLKAQAKRLGLPLLIKASAGGGGKGMRLAHSLEEFPQELAAAKREAQNAFGDDGVLLEKFISKPRHIEVQVLSDTHGGHFHFWERECSIQRRHQKIIEETPSAALDEALRQKICQTAVKICQAINYQGAGTVEFILDEEKNFYFLEMNTRLQVEHPITEMATGHDLVEWQIRVARGEKIKLKQSDITQNGHALEVRIYAEDCDCDFLPTTGVLNYIGQTRLSSTRLECGYQTPQSIGIAYDPMLAKLCTHALDRESNIKKMGHLLDDYPFLGIKTNVDYLKRILKIPEFISGDFSTQFVAHHQEDLGPAQLDDEALATIAGAYFLLGPQQGPKEQTSQSKRPSLFAQMGSFRNS